MNRPLVVGLVGGAIVIFAIALTFVVDRGSKPPVQQDARSPAPATAPPGAAGDELAAPSRIERPTAPSFDVVRVNPQGDAVIAGRAEPNAQVTIREGSREIGKVQADPRGEWVLVPKQPLAPGSRELSLSAQSPNGEKTASKENVVVVVPERGKDIAGEQTGASGALALRVPSGGGIGTTVLQKPGGDGDQAVAQRPQGPAPQRNGSEPVRRTLTLDAVDYDDAGHVALSGQAPDGARVQVYLDNRLLGAGTVGMDRVWRVAPTDRTVPPGLYTLRIDQVDGSGKVVARVETRFVRAEPLGALPRDAVVYVQPGNSLWRLARQAYGAGMQYTVIYEANRSQIRDPDLIYPGQVFLVPRVN